jgi:hypothetical protein
MPRRCFHTHEMRACIRTRKWHNMPPASANLDLTTPYSLGQIAASSRAMRGCSPRKLDYRDVLSDTGHLSENQTRAPATLKRFRRACICPRWGFPGMFLLRTAFYSVANGNGGTDVPAFNWSATLPSPIGTSGLPTSSYRRISRLDDPEACPQIEQHPVLECGNCARYPPDAPIPVRRTSWITTSRLMAIYIELLLDRAAKTQNIPAVIPDLEGS